MATPTNLPATATAGQVLTAQYVNDLRGGFRVLQVVFASTSTIQSSSTSTFADSGLTATITPQATSSKILVLTNNAVAKTAANSLNGVNLRLVRGATTIASYTAGLFTNTGVINIGSCDMNFLDSPATTSATTYKIQFANFTAAAAAEYAANNSLCTMTLMEISA
jgi:hypothetical protein